MSCIDTSDVRRLCHGLHEGAIICWTNKHVSIRANCELAGVDKARGHRADARDIKNVLNQKLEGTVGLLLVPPALGEREKDLPEQTQTLSRYTRDVDNRSQIGLVQLINTRRNILLVPHRKGALVDVRSTQQLVDLLLGIFHGMLWTTIDLGEDNDDRNAKGAAQIQMMLRHVSRRMPAIHQDQTIVRHARRDAMNSRFEILLMTREINQRTDTVRFPGHLVVGLPLVSADRILP